MAYEYRDRVSTSTRKSRAKYLALCLTCEQEVGVRVSNFTKTPNSRYSERDTPKIVRHINSKTDTWCRGSGLSVHPSAMMERT